MDHTPIIKVIKACLTMSIVCEQIDVIIQPVTTKACVTKEPK